MHSVDDFVPDEGLDKSFLEDSVSSGAKAGMNTQPQTTTADSDRYGTHHLINWNVVGLSLSASEGSIVAEDVYTCITGI